MKYILVDAANLFFKSLYTASKRSNEWEKIGFSIHLVLNGINHVINKLHDDCHVVICLEGRSWRRQYYSAYKANRDLIKANSSPEELEQSKLFWESFQDLCNFLKEKTNVSVLHSSIAEADDLIARFIALHPENEHIIISSDGDFVQLVDNNVCLYNSLSKHMITKSAIYDDRNRKVSFTIGSNTKIKIGNPDDSFTPDSAWIEYALFLKCIRGDSGDNIFSAYPGAREKGTKKKVGIKEAFADRHNKGFNWNNLMLQQWVDHEKVQHKVLNVYEFNRILIDLTAQPNEIKRTIDDNIVQCLNKTEQKNIGLNFLKFCGKFELNTISENSEQYSRWMKYRYTGSLQTIQEI